MAVAVAVQMLKGLAVDYRAVFQDNGCAQVVSNAYGFIVDCNSVFWSLLGYTRAEMLTKHWAAIETQTQGQQTRR